jgi:two-component system, response regulator
MLDDAVEILIVEDNPTDLELALRALRQHNFCNNIHTARDGAEALEFLFGEGQYEDRRDASPPRLILLDLKLPLVDGIEVLRRVRGDPRTRCVPVVVMTSSTEERDLVDCYALGANSYIQKPVDFDKFSEAMRLVGMYWLLLNRPAVAA